MTYDRWEIGEWYKTRGGYKAQVLDVDYKGRCGITILGKINIDGNEDMCSWKSDGCYNLTESPHRHDLMPPVERKELWVNVYKGLISVRTWSSKERADKNADSTRIGLIRIGLIRIIIEGDDFTVERVM